jgi:hypothetical protein
VEKSPSQKTVAIIGGINRDEVRGLDGRLIRGWGGILFNIAALRKFGPRTMTILPIAYLGRDARRRVGRWVRALPQVDLGALIPLEQRSNVCRMQYHSPTDRRESLHHVVPALKFTDIRAACRADLILVNFISGRDVTLRALERLRDEYDGPIHIDIHSYLLGRRRDGSRFRRLPQGWLRVVTCADILQVNETEFAILSRAEPEPRAVRTWAREILTSLRCRCLLITLARRGAYAVIRRGRTWSLTHFPATSRPRNIDPTGAGDTFTGAWIPDYLLRRDPLAATRLAVRRAARPTRPAI